MNGVARGHRRSIVLAAVVVVVACALVAGCASGQRPTVAPTTAATVATAATAATATTGTTATPSSVNASGAPVGTTAATSVETSTTTALPSGPATWAADAVIAALAPVAGPDTPIVVDALDGVALVRRVDPAGSGPVLVIVEPDGRVSVAPRTAVGSTDSSTAARFGDHVLVAVQGPDGTPSAVVHTIGTDRWTKVAVAAPAGAYVTAAAMGERGLLTFTGPADAVGGDRWAGYVVAADGTVAPVPEPPDSSARPGTGTLTLWSGRELLVLARDSAADDQVLAKPYAFDPSTRVWRPIATPTWLTCGERCAWAGPHEGGDPFLLTMAGGLAVLHASVGAPGTSELFTGAYDPVADAWKELDQPPIPLELAVAIDVSAGSARGLVAVPTSAFRGDHPDRAARLDLATGRWTTEKLAVPPVGRGAGDPGLAEVRRGPGRLLVGVYAMGDAAPDRPDAVLDGGAWRAPTDADARLWRRLGTSQTTLRQLLG